MKETNLGHSRKVFALYPFHNCSGVFKVKPWETNIENHRFTHEESSFQMNSNCGSTLSAAKSSGLRNLGLPICFAVTFNSNFPARLQISISTEN